MASLGPRSSVCAPGAASARRANAPLRHFSLLRGERLLARVRLLHWEALAYGEAKIPDERARTAYYREKTSAFAAAQREGILIDQPGPDHLLFLTLALALWWFAVPQLARMITGTKQTSRAEQTRRRAAVVHAARSLAHS